MSWRRTIAAGVVGALALTGCSGSGKDALAADLATAAKGVDGVSSAELAYEKGSAGTAMIVGDVTLSTSDATASAEALKGVYTAMVPVLKDGGSASLRFETKDANGQVVPASVAGFNGFPTSSQVIAKFGG